MSARARFITIDTEVSVDVSPEDLEERGWHHEDTCPATTGKACAHPDRDVVDVAIEELHQQAGHGEYPARACLREPCRSLYLIPLGDDAQVARRTVA